MKVEKRDVHGKKRIKGTTTSAHYRAEEKKRVNGKSKRSWQKYFGPLPKIIEAVEGTPLQPRFAEIFQLGGPAAYLNTAEQNLTAENLKRSALAICLAGKRD